MARATAIYNQTLSGNSGNTLDDFYTSGFGSELSFQKLKSSSLVITYGTTIADGKGVYSNGTLRSTIPNQQQEQVQFELDSNSIQALIPAPQ